MQGYGARETAAMFGGTLLSYTTCDSERIGVRPASTMAVAPLLGATRKLQDRFWSLLPACQGHPSLAASALVAPALLTAMPQNPPEDLL
jgi:hypothetical protein